ncbi:hypothetical protein HS9_03206 [Bacillus velezensis]|nr:hypothetical protein HS9_03206 [Bacillus velezensis]
MTFTTMLFFGEEQLPPFLMLQYVSLLFVHIFVLYKYMYAKYFYMFSE